MLSWNTWSKISKYLRRSAASGFLFADSPSTGSKRRVVRAACSGSSFRWNIWVWHDESLKLSSWERDGFQIIVSSISLLSSNNHHQGKGTSLNTIRRQSTPTSLSQARKTMCDTLSLCSNSFLHGDKYIYQICRSTKRTGVITVLYMLMESLICAGLLWLAGYPVWGANLFSY